MCIYKIDDINTNLQSLTNLTDLIEGESLIHVYLGLVDIMFAYAYNHRVTEGENNVSTDVIQWTLIYPDTSVTKSTVCITEYLDK